MSRPDVPRYYRISTRFWDDEKSRVWPRDVKLLALYLLTCRHRTLEGIFFLPLSYVREDLAWNSKKLSKMMAVLTANQFLRYDPETRVMLIRNALRYQAPESQNVVTGAIRRIRDLPKSPLLEEFLGLAKLHCSRQGASEYACKFYDELERALGRSLEQPSPRALELLTSDLNHNHNLNLQPQSESQSEPTPIDRPNNGDRGAKRGSPPSLQTREESTQQKVLRMGGLLGEKLSMPTADPEPKSSEPSC